MKRWNGLIVKALEALFGETEVLDIQELVKGLNYKDQMKFRIFAFSFVLFSLMAAAQVESIEKLNRNSSLESGYYYAFTEATKLYMIGDYKSALGLYMECLKYRPNSAAVSYQISQIYMKAGEINKAKVFAKRAYDNEPGNKWYAYSLAGIYEISQLADSALMIYKLLLVEDGNNLNTYFTMASLYEKTGNSKEALRYLGLIEQEIGVSKEVAISRARVLSAQGDRRGSLKELYKALSFGLDDYIVLGMLAENYRNQGMVDSATRYYNLIIKDYRNDAGVSLSFGEFLLEQQKFDSAASWYIGFIGNEQIDVSVKSRYFYNVIQERKLFELIKPVLDTISTVFLSKYNSDIRVKSIFSDIQIRLGNYRRSVSILKEIVTADGNNYVGWEQLLYCYNIDNQYDSVIFYGNRTIRVFERRPVPYLFVGSAYYSRKDWGNAITYLQKGLGFAENDVLKLEFFSILASCYDEKKDYAKADECFKRALEIDVYNAAINNNYAYYLSVRGERLEDAKRMSRIAVSAEPDNPTFLDTYAWVLFRMGKKRKAKEVMEKALLLGGSKNAEILDHMGDIYFSLKQQDQARVFWERAIEKGDKDMKERIELKLQQF
jgi:tetratricopeptide (TPR) repeat protein